MATQKGKKSKVTDPTAAQAGKGKSPSKKPTSKQAPPARKGKGGRPPKYHDAIPDQARKVCASTGATDVMLADYFEVKVTTIDHWKQVHPLFLQALKDGKDEFDTKHVEKALLHRAIGYEHPEEDIRTVSIGDGMSEIVKTPTIKRYPPDTTAAIFWLKNRNRDRWRDKQDIDHGLQEDNPLAALIGAVSGNTLRPVEEGDD